MTLEVVLVAGPPVAWSVSLAEYAAPGAPPSATAEERDLGAITAGAPFYMEVEALDAFNNKCVDGCSGQGAMQGCSRSGAAPAQGVTAHNGPCSITCSALQCCPCIALNTFLPGTKWRP